MAEKPRGRVGQVKEQIIDDPVTGLTLQICVDKSGYTKLVILGDLPMGNREHIFYPDGSLMGSGTYMTQCPTSSWLSLVKE